MVKTFVRDSCGGGVFKDVNKRRQAPQQTKKDKIMKKTLLLAVAAAREHRRHERLVGDLLEQPPLRLGEPRVGGELLAAQREQLVEPLQRADRLVDLGPLLHDS